MAAKRTGLATYLADAAVKAQITSLVGEKSAPTFISSIVSAVNTNPTLAECTNSSILAGALLGESLHLTPSPQLGQYYLVPYENSKKHCKEAQFQMGAKGYKQLAIRTGQYEKIVVSTIKEGELKYFNPITEDIRFEAVMDEKKRQSLPTIGYYAMFKLTNGFIKELYWSKEKMLAHAENYSQGYRSDMRNGTTYTFWAKDFDGMGEKTMIRQLISKWGIMSVEMQTAFEKDMAIISEDGSAYYIDNEENHKEAAEDEIVSSEAIEEFAEKEAKHE